MFLRTLRRGGALVLGLGAGLGFAFALCLPFALTGKPRCPRCDSRAQVEAVQYAPLPDGTYSVSAPGRYLGTWDAARLGPEWLCRQCGSPLGSRRPADADP